MGASGSDTTDRDSTTKRVTGWAVGLAGAVALVAAANRFESPVAWVALSSAAVIALATVLGGPWAGATSALVAAALVWLQLDDEVGSSVELAIAVGICGAALALVVAAAQELRRRERLRGQWLSRLGGLSEALADAATRHDPRPAIEEAARHAVDAASVAVLSGIAQDEVGTGTGEELGAGPARANRTVVTSSGQPPLVLEVELRAEPPLSLADEHAAFLRSVADQCAAGLERAALLRAERQAQDDLELLARASTALSASLDLERVASTIDELLVPYLADACTLTVVRSDRRDAPSSVAPTDGDASVIPLRDRGEVIGHLTLSRTARPLTEVEHRAASLVAEPASRALAHALLFSEQVRTSSTLEHSLLPESTLPIPNLQIATRYLAAAEGHAAGGDFYDVLQAPAGGAVLVVGDVQGKGVEAATLTSTARHTLRAAALAGATPAEMLHQLNRALLYGHAERVAATGKPTVRFVTASVVRLAPTQAGFRAVVASGGHPPPLLVHPGGEVEQLVVEGPLLGVFDEPRYDERVVDLGLSDVLVLYTDGVTEQRQQPELFDEAQLGRLVRNMLTARHADAVAQQILDTVVVLSPREVRDDIALVVARVTGPR
jgi:serine phosphatase RsbU (regulator of sigma subunit)